MLVNQKISSWLGYYSGINQWFKCNDDIDKKKIGFFVKYKKSVFNPTQEIAFPGNVINSVKINITFKDERKENIFYECKKLHYNSLASIRNVAIVIGFIVFSFPAIELGFYIIVPYKKEKKMKLLF